MSLTPPTAEELRWFRKTRGLSQAALGEKLGASTRAVEEWEAGRRAPPAMLRLAMAALVANITWLGLSLNGVPLVEDTRLGERDD